MLLMLVNVVDAAGVVGLQVTSVARVLALLLTPAERRSFNQ